MESFVVSDDWLKLADRAVSLRDLYLNPKCTADSLKLSIMRLADEANKLITESVIAEVGRANR